MVLQKFTPASLFLLGGLLVFSSPVSAAWNVSGTVKNTTGSTLDGVLVTVKDSASSLKSTTSDGGQFSIVQSVGVRRDLTPREFSVSQFGTELSIAFPGTGVLEMSLVDLSGSVLWKGVASVDQGYARLSLPAIDQVGPAILRVSQGKLRASQPITLLGSRGVSVTPRISARSLASYPTLVFKKVGYADTTYVMTAASQTGIAVAMRDSTTPKSTVCNLPPSPSAGSGSFTRYSFSQGTGAENGYYRTACGYRGVVANGTDTMLNLAYGKYFAAIPSNSPSDFNKSDMCGACVEVTGQNGTKVVATITDECPLVDNDGKPFNEPCRSNTAGHLDLSAGAMSQLGFSTDYPRSTNWKYVKCPVRGNVIVRMKQGNSDQVYIENTILPVKEVKVGSNVGTRLSYGPWKVSRNALGATLVITDYSDRSITVSIPTNAGVDKDYNTGVQFPECQ